MGRIRVGAGWDRDAVLVDGTWIERTARRPDAEPGLRVEARLLPWLATRLPLPVPQPVVTSEHPLVVRHRLVAGAPCDDPSPADGHALGAFLRALHDVPVDEAVAHGLPDPATTRRRRAGAFDRFAAEVLPRLPDPAPIRRRLDRLAAAPAEVPVHGDLRAEHVLTDGGAVRGVIDWGDARAGDPAKDLGWPVLGTAGAVARAVLAAYDPTGDVDELVARSRDWQEIGPCYAVLHGLDTGDGALVEAALAALVRSAQAPQIGS